MKCAEKTDDWGFGFGVWVSMSGKGWVRNRNI